MQQGHACKARECVCVAVELPAGIGQIAWDQQWQKGHVTGRAGDSGRKGNAREDRTGLWTARVSRTSRVCGREHSLRHARAQTKVGAENGIGDGRHFKPAQQQRFAAHIVQAGPVHHCVSAISTNGVSFSRSNQQQLPIRVPTRTRPDPSASSQSRLGRRSAAQSAPACYTTIRPCVA